MAFEGLSQRLEAAFKKLRSKGKLSESDVKSAMREVRLALLEADVSYKVAKDFTNSVTERAIGSHVMESLTPAQMVIKIVNEELTALMGGKAERIKTAAHPPTVVMMCGLQGSGKTTHSAKIALMLKNNGNRPLLAACDVYRPAAIDQLKVVGGKVGVPVFEMGKEDPVRIAREAVKLAKDQGYDYVLLDTAGRLHVDEELMEELKRIKAEVGPSEILLVIDSMTGQDAVNVAASFDEALGITGVVLTKLDGDTRGGAAISIRSVVDKPLKFISSGEKMDALQVFHPERMADRILGMGDVVSLVERAQEQFDEAEARKLKKKLVKDQFNFNDFLAQINQIKKMGNLKDLASMIPGMGKALKGVEISDDVFKQTEAIIGSMTPAERERPEILNARRRERIAKGSGTTMADVNRLLKQFDDTRKMMKMVAGGGKMKLPQMPRGFRR